MRRYRGDIYDSADELIAAITRHLERMSGYSIWTIGTTRNAQRCYHDLEEPPFWAFWVAEQPDVAQSVKEHFIALGMKADTGSTPGEVVYIY
jgi:hypothetical protein